MGGRGLGGDSSGWWRWWSGRSRAPRLRLPYQKPIAARATTAIAIPIDIPAMAPELRPDPPLSIACVVAEEGEDKFVEDGVDSVDERVGGGLVDEGED